MAEPQEPVIVPASADAPAAAPVTVTETPVAPIEPIATPTATETPAASPIEAAAPSEPAKVETPTPHVENVLGDDAPKPEEKKDVKPEGDKAEAPTEPKVDAPVYEEFKLPDGTPENVRIEKEVLGDFSKILGEIETGKLDHKGYQDAGQKLIDLAAKNTVDSINRLNDYYVQFHENQKKEWFESAKKDADLGNGDEGKFREIAEALRTSIDEYAGSETQKSEFRQLMKETGVGNHPALLRMLNNMQKKIDSYTKEGSDNRIVQGQRPAPGKVKDYQRFYQGGNQ